MARGPILSRKSFFEKVNRNKPIVRLLDWNLVEVDMGSGQPALPMVEPRACAPFADGKVVDLDLLDTESDSYTYMDGGDFQANYMTYGSQLTKDFSY